MNIKNIFVYAIHNCLAAGYSSYRRRRSYSSSAPAYPDFNTPINSFALPPSDLDTTVDMVIAPVDVVRSSIETALCTVEGLCDGFVVDRVAAAKVKGQRSLDVIAEIINRPDIAAKIRDITRFSKNDMPLDATGTAAYRRMSDSLNGAVTSSLITSAPVPDLVTMADLIMNAFNQADYDAIKNNEINPPIVETVVTKNPDNSTTITKVSRSPSSNSPVGGSQSFRRSYHRSSRRRSSRG